jgi:hypothetical protein
MLLDLWRDALLLLLKRGVHHLEPLGDLVRHRPVLLFRPDIADLPE